MKLKPYAVHDASSLGREWAETAPENRTEFQRDRDRIIHSSAFRRLEYKTQVFVNHEGDWFRTRLTHSLEVAQIGRTLSRNLGLNEDLAEAIALAHDLGHTPFGHAGQDALNTCMEQWGGFEHNFQSLRVVDCLEERYVQFNGLNLMYETREGILKRCSRRNAKEIGRLGKRFIAQTQPNLEAQVVNLADEIAYNNHDIDDGLRSGLITLKQLSQVEIWQAHYEPLRRSYTDTTERRLIHETIRRMINTLVLDLLRTTQDRIDQLKPDDVDTVRNLPPLAGFSSKVLNQHQALKQFLFRNLYRHPHVEAMNHKAKRIIQQLFELFLDNPRLLPEKFQVTKTPSCSEDGKAEQARRIADYIAGMTDRSAIGEFRRHFVVDESKWA